MRSKTRSVHRSPVLVTVIFLLLVYTKGIFPQPVNDHGNLKVVGSQLQDKNSQPVILRGQGYGWHNWWPQYWNADVVKWLADDWKCEILRAAVGIEPAGAYLDDPVPAKNLTKTVVDAAIDEGLYVIIDWHAHEINQNEAVAFFTEMAQTYGNYPNVIYEIFNEPVEQTWDDVKTYSTAVINAIRQHDQDNIIIVGCPHWDQDIDKVADSPLTGYTNIIYSVHFYAATHGKWLRDRCDYALGKNIPIIVSECSGCPASGTGEIDYDEWKLWIDYMDTKNISWLNYSISDKSGEACSVLLPGAPSTGGWTSSQLNESGIYMRDVLRSYTNTAISEGGGGKAICRPELTLCLNPLKTAVAIGYVLPEAAPVTLSVYYLTGRLITEVVNGRQDAGVHKMAFDATDLISGVYLFRLCAGNFYTSSKIILAK